MPGLAFPVAVVTAVIITSAALWFKHGRHPFGHREWRPAFWWTSIAVADALVAAAILGGGVAAIGLNGLTELGWVSWIAIGALGPLGLRSPVRKTKVGDKEEPVGLTEYYDRYRIACDRQLDDQLTRLRRRDREKILEILSDKGWSDVALCGAIVLHASELRSRDQLELEDLKRRLKVALSLTSEDERLDALTKVMLDERFSSLVRDVQSRGPKQTEIQAGQDLAASG